MPKRTDIESILIIGSGPIVIGQACEFDYSGTQACRVLREEGYRVVLANSNPATIMTDPDFADATYVEPITPEVVAKIIERERPDAVLATLGGQTGLNTAMSLYREGLVGVPGTPEMIGANATAIETAEDRELFKQAMIEIGLRVPQSATAHSLDEAVAAVEQIGLPVIIRPAYILGGRGTGIAATDAEFRRMAQAGIDASPIGEILIERSIAGWKEFELEVMRDRADNCVIVCSIENVDPMGVHTGDSITVAPAQTLTDREYQEMRDAAFACIRRVGVETGGSNVQFAVDPATGRMVVIEMNPRVSRSSALASKATGFPIAKVAARLAVGYTLDELLNDITGETPASFEPTIDYVVTKMPRFAFEKFPGAEPLLNTSMKSVGEAMSIGRTFQESLQKALRSMETGLTGLNEIEIKGAPDRSAIVGALARPTPDRILVIAQAFRNGLSVEEVAQASKYEPWFLRQIEQLVQIEASLRKNGLPKDAKAFFDVKKKGFSDERLGELTGQSAADVAKKRRELGVRPVFKRIDTCAAEFESRTPYLYSCYEGDGVRPAECEAQPTDRRKVIILGGGPNRIGQGIEFDYCCVHAVYALREAGYETIMVNCNPETVSTDYDTADRLYFEPLTAEDVIELVEVERRSGELLGLIVQFGGQTPLKLAKPLEAAGIPILGTSPDAIDLAEDRERFQKLIQELKLRQPDNGTATSQEKAIEVAERIGYPVVIRPSYVLGGRAMQIVYDRSAIERYMRDAVKVSGSNPVLIDSYLRDAIEVDVDALADKDQNVFVAGIMEHIEEAGIHSGDSACSLPPYSLSAKIMAEIERQTEAMAKALHVVGLMNVQFAVKDGEVYVLEVNPRASRTVPFVAKATGQPIAKFAARLMAGEALKSLGIKKPKGKHIAVKEAVFPFARFPGVDIILGPEMRSTGEVMGLDMNFGRAFAKSQLGAGSKVPVEGVVFVSVKDQDKQAMVKPVKRLVELGFKVVATRGTSVFLRKHGIETQEVNKVLQGRPHIVDLMKDGKVHLVFNTVDGAGALTDSFTLRRTALMHKIAYYTTVAGAKASVEGIAALKEGALDVAPLQSYFKTAF